MKLKFRMEGGVLWESNSILMQFVRDIQLGIHVNPPHLPPPLFPRIRALKYGNTDVFDGGV